MKLWLALLNLKHLLLIFVWSHFLVSCCYGLKSQKTSVDTSIIKTPPKLKTYDVKAFDHDYEVMNKMVKRSLASNKMNLPIKEGENKHYEDKTEILDYWIDENKIGLINEPTFLPALPYIDEEDQNDQKSFWSFWNIVYIIMAVIFIMLILALLGCFSDCCSIVQQKKQNTMIATNMAVDTPRPDGVVSGDSTFYV